MKTHISRVSLCGCLVAMMSLLMNTSTGVAQSGYQPPINLTPLPLVVDVSQPLAVNNSGQAVGWYAPGPINFSPETGAFSWTPTGGPVAIGGPVRRFDQNAAVAVNDSGQVVVDISKLGGHPNNAFLWTLGAELVDLGTLGGTESEATAINASGQITGWSSTTTGARHAFFWTAAAGMRDLGTLGGELSEARAINDTGRVIGWSEIGGVHHAFSWTASEGMVDLGTLGGANSEGVAVNATGRVVGWSEIAIGDDAVHAFSWTLTGGMVDLGTLGGMSSKANAVSATGQIVGWSEIAIGDIARHAFSWTPAGGMLDLGTLGRRDSEASAVNAAGRVAGTVQTPRGIPATNSDRRAFSWTAGEGMVDLGTLGGSESYASGLNERGDIVGSSTLVPTPPLPSPDYYPAFKATMWRRLVPDVTPPTDITPPTLLLPTTIVVDGTSPAGATVTYTVSATDNVDPNPVVICSPPSGSVFPLQESIVSCTATDAAGNSVTGTFQVVVLDARQQLQATINLIGSYQLTRLGTSLTDKLQLASGYIAFGDIGEACGVLTGFLNQVRAQAGKALTEDQATELTIRANRIRNVIGC
jgi:probable HAF family extracellular repeat protein